MNDSEFRGLPYLSRRPRAMVAGIRCAHPGVFRLIFNPF